MGKRIVIEPVKCTLEGLIEGAFSEISSLADEMREAYDNTPESLQSSSVGEARGEAADTLENYVDAPEVPEFMSSNEVQYRPLAQKRRGHSRATRCGQATYELGVAVEECDRVIETFDEQIAAMQKLIDAQTDEGSIEAGEAAIETLEERKGEAEELRDEIQQAIDECDGVTFPGMYG